MSDLRVCYVVNGISETSVPATLGLAVDESTNVSVDLLAWFDAEPFEGSDRLNVYCLDAPQTTLGIDHGTYRSARDLLESYDLVQAHHNHSGSFAKVIARRLGIPTVSREGNTRNGFTRKGRVVNGITNPFSAYVVCNSQAVYNSFMSWERTLLSTDRIRIIPNGVDLDRVQQAIKQNGNVRDEYDIDPSTVLVGNASMFTEQKAHDVLIGALQKANRRSDQRYELVLAGDGPLRTDTEERVYSEELSDYVHFLGLLNRNQIYQVMDKLDVYSMPSRWEGFANAAVEALGVGNACIFSDIEPFTIPYENVSLFHPVDDTDMLADRIIEFGENPPLRDEYRQRGKKLTQKKYSLPKIAQKYSKLYQEVNRS